MRNKTEKSKSDSCLFFSGVHMKRWLLGFIIILMLALATTVFAVGPECWMSRPSLGEPGSKDPTVQNFSSRPPFSQRSKSPDVFYGKQEMQPPDGIGPFASLQLSEEQMEKLRALADRSFRETRELRYDLSAKYLEMKKLFSDPKTNEATLIAKQKELSSIRHRLLDRMDQMIIEGRKILTHEQIQKLDYVSLPHGNWR